MMQMLGNFGKKRKLYFNFSQLVYQGEGK